MPNLIVAIELLIGAVVARCIYLVYFHPLSRYPGPPLACITNLWYDGPTRSYHEPSILTRSSGSSPPTSVASIISSSRSSTRNMAMSFESVLPVCRFQVCQDLKQSMVSTRPSKKVIFMTLAAKLAREGAAFSALGVRPIIVCGD